MINHKCRLATYAKHPRYLNQHILVSSFFDYQVVILNITINLIWTKVKGCFYGMTATSKYHPYPRVSQRFVSIYIPARENLKTRHTWAMNAPQVATICDNDQRVRRGAPFPGAHLPRDTTRWAIHGWSVHYPGKHHCTRGEGLSNSVTVEATKFAGPHKSCMRRYIIKLAHRG
jgi:hypothetical protein